MPSLLRSLSEGVRAAHQLDRRANPHLFAEKGDVLFPENVADLLGCEVSYLVMPPLSAIPRRSIGHRILYLREEVLDFLRGPEGRSSVQPVATLPLICGRPRSRRIGKRQLERAIQAARAMGGKTLEIGFRDDGTPVVKVTTASAPDDVASEIEAWASGG